MSDFEDRQKKEDEGCAFFACAVCVLVAFWFGICTGFTIKSCKDEMVNLYDRIEKLLYDRIEKLETENHEKLPIHNEN